MAENMIHLNQVAGMWCSMLTRMLDRLLILCIFIGCSPFTNLENDPSPDCVHSWEVLIGSTVDDRRTLRGGAAMVAASDRRPRICHPRLPNLPILKLWGFVLVLA